MPYPQMPRVPVPRKIRFDVFRRDSYTCRYCGAKPPDTVLVIDHMVPIHAGGRNSIDNLVTACMACNQGKGPTVLDEDQFPDFENATYIADLVQDLMEIAVYRDYMEMRDMHYDIVSAQIAIRTKGEHGWSPTEAAIRQVLMKYDPWIVDEASKATAAGVARRKVASHKRAWMPYFWGVARNICVLSESGEEE